MIGNCTNARDENFFSSQFLTFSLLLFLDFFVLLAWKAWNAFTDPKVDAATETLVYCLAAWMKRGLKWDKKKLRALMEDEGLTREMAEAELLNELVGHSLSLLLVLVTGRQLPAGDENTISRQLTAAQKGRIRGADAVPQSRAFFSGNRALERMVSDQSELEPQYQVTAASRAHRYSNAHRPFKAHTRKPTRFAAAAAPQHEAKVKKGEHPRVLQHRPWILAPPPSEPVRERPFKGNGSKPPTPLRTMQEERSLALAKARELDLSENELEEYEEAAASGFIEVASKTIAKKKKGKFRERRPFKQGVAYATASFSRGHAKSDRNKAKGSERAGGKSKSSDQIGLNVFNRFQGFLSRTSILCNIHTVINSALRPHAATMVEAARAQKLLGTIRFNSLHNTLKLVLSPSFSATPEGMDNFRRWATLLFGTLGEGYQSGIQLLSNLLFRTIPTFEEGSGHEDPEENETAGGSKMENLFKMAAPGMAVVKVQYEDNLLKNNCLRMASNFHNMYANKVIPILLGHLRNLLESSDLGKEFELVFEILFPKGSRKSNKDGLFALLALIFFASTDLEEEDDENEDDEDEAEELDLSFQELEALENEKEKQSKGLKGLRDAFSTCFTPALGTRKFDLSTLTRARSMIRQISNFHNHTNSQKAINILSEAVFHFQHSFDQADSCL